MPLIPLTDSDFNHYLIAALFSSTDEDESLDARYEATDFHATAIAKSRLDCEAFLVENEQDVAALLDGDHEMPDIMHDFWLTRNGHGCGFWDGDYPKEIGDRLTESSDRFGEVNLYVGDEDGAIWLSGSENDVV